jgi:branched-chain amino acid transport system permease protein
VRPVQSGVKARIARRFSSRLLVTIVILILLFLIPTFVSSSFYLRLIVVALYMIMLVAGFRLALGAGVFSMAQQAFFGIGAYTLALLVTRLDWNWWLSALLAGVVAAASAAIVGRILLRLKGIFFAISTLAFAFVLLLIWKTFSFFGGHNGIFNIPDPDPIFGFEFGSLVSYFYLALVLAAITMLVMYRIEKSRYGFTLRCIGLDADLARSTGVNVTLYRITAFCIACFFAGIAGAFFASFQGTIQPDTFGFDVLMLILLYAVIGGVHSVWGPIYGVVIMKGITTGLTYIPNYDPKTGPIILGATLVVVMLRFPNGIGFLLERIPGWLREARSKKEDELYVNTSS